MFVLAVSMMITSCFAQEILQNPDNTTAFLDDDVMFSCVTSGGVSSWKVNGTFFEELSIKLRRDLEIGNTPNADGNTHLTLTIPAKAKYNGTRVQCVSAASGSTPVDSRNAFLFIQGPLSAVGNLETTLNTTTVTVTWDAPFTLDVTGVDPDIWYSIIIYNVTDINNPVLINCSDCTNILHTHYVFEQSLSPCHTYNFSVIPFNEVGEGEISLNVTLVIQFTTVESTGSNSLRLNEVVLFNRYEESFIVLESVETETILFRGLAPNSDSVCNIIDTIMLQKIPTTTYNILFYFTGRGTTSYRMLYELMNVSVQGKDDFSTIVSSEVLDGARIVYNDVQRRDIYCYFKEQSAESYCIVVYKEYGDETLLVHEYSQTTEFPVTILVNDEKNYTIAIFGKGAGVIDNEPIVIQQQDDEDNPLPIDVIVAVVVVVVIILLVVVLVIVILWQLQRKRIKSHYRNSIEHDGPKTTKQDSSPMTQSTEFSNVKYYGTQDSGAECPEIITLRELLLTITKSFTTDGTLQTFANKLVNKNLVSPNKAKEILSADIPDEKAEQLILSVITSIERVENKNELFEKFVDIMHESNHEDLAQKLRETVQTVKTRIITEDDAQNVETAEEGIKVVEAESISMTDNVLYEMKNPKPSTRIYDEIK